MKFDPANNIQDLQYFGEFGGVNPSISDSSTYTFLSAKKMFDTFEGNAEGCYLYSRHSSPSGLYLSEALAAMEGAEAAHIASTGMGAITAAILQLCGQGDHLVVSRTIYGGTYAFLKNLAPRFGVTTTFVDHTDLDAVESAIQKNTKVIYVESVSNPLLEVADIPSLSKISRKHNLQLLVDNTFTPMMISPIRLGADVVLHSLTKFINGSSDTMGGVICGSREFIDRLKNVNDGTSMLLGASMDSLRAASILKNLRTLHIRMKQHSFNASFLAERFQADGLRVVYPGLVSHAGHLQMCKMIHEEYGYGGMMTLDVGSLEKANQLMELMQERNLGYLAVSLGFYKTLFSAPGTSTSSEIPEEEQLEMGLSDGLIRFSIGLDQDIDRTYQLMVKCMREVGILEESPAVMA
ncbi:aminotransferase class I/II-fold pyridoxal phosphate-dependent enzyme [Aureitalea marina]|uniref:Cystathionine beta-lyase n=1 Tax=Aureitalea marina TaxID=930804 RepID=A0A2S7KNG9_9FLAO|nr:aminotransferase class I/II-fold pyridoxal phosphate-dependent enzyme [Aureitalea marina]PQB04138.1 cystathionine beta-lyase [Aureitalea marina]